MPRIYTVRVENVSVTNANGDADMVELDAAAEKPIELFGIQLFNLSELQEAQEEWLRFTVGRGHTTTGNGTSQTPRPVDPTGQAAGFVAETYSSTIASGGTNIELNAFGMNVRAGYEIFYPEGCGFGTQGAELLVVRLMAAPADDLNMSATFWVREFG